MYLKVSMKSLIVSILTCNLCTFRKKLTEGKPAYVYSTKIDSKNPAIFRSVDRHEQIHARVITAEEG